MQLTIGFSYACRRHGRVSSARQRTYKPCLSPTCRLRHRISLPSQSILARTAHTQRLEDSRMNVVALLFVIVFAWWLSTLIID
jgi:hypothetical protein